MTMSKLNLVKHTLQPPIFELDTDKDTNSERSQLLKNQSDVDALLLALRRKRELNENSTEQNEFESNFDDFIKHQLKVIQNRKNRGRNRRSFRNKCNRSMEYSDPANHPFLNIAKKELKELNYTPLKIKSICNEGNENDYNASCSPSKKKPIIPLNKIKRRTEQNQNFKNIMPNFKPKFSNILSNSGRQTADFTGDNSRRSQCYKINNLKRNISSMQEERLKTASSVCLSPMSPEPKIKDSFVFNDQLNVSYSNTNKKSVTNPLSAQAHLRAIHNPKKLTKKHHSDPTERDRLCISMFNGQKECESFSNQLMLSMPFKLNSKFGTRSKDISTRETSLNISDIKSPVLKYEPKSRAGKKKTAPRSIAFDEISDFYSYKSNCL